MARISYTSASPYSATPQTSWYLANYVHRKVSASPDDQTIAVTTKYEFRPDLLSFDLYGTPAYWWVFILRNRNLMKDPIWDLKSGMTIKAPTASTLKKILGN